MNKIAKRGAALLAGLALPMTLGGAAARAQDVPGQKPFALKAGFFYTTGKEARQAGGDGMLALEAEYTLQTLIERGGMIANTHIGVGYTEHDNLRIVPITVSETFHDSRGEPGMNYYYGLGIGIYITRMDAPGVSGDPKNLLGGFVVGGVDFPNNLFGELKFHLISRYDDKNVSGFQAAVGMRF